MAMKIAVVFGSHRRTGKNKEIEDMLTNLKFDHELDIIRMADIKIEGCSSCYKCANEKECIIQDDFSSILNRLINADIIFIITPVYSAIPSKLTALFERLTSLLFATELMNTERNPLYGKGAAIFNYCSCGIVDETPIKLIFQKFLMKEYSFFEVNYMFINNCPNADEKYNHNVCEYIKDVVLSL